MREKSVFNKFEDIKILYQFLYMSEDHSFVFHNSIGIPLKIYMDDNLNFWCENLNFPEIEPILYNDMMGRLENVLGMIECLKEEPPVKTQEDNLWSEICLIVKINLSI